MTEARDMIQSTGNNVDTKLLEPPQDLKYLFAHVNYTIKPSSTSAGVHILHEICGEFKSGRFTAILGASGAGKTSMLNVLSGFKANGVTGYFGLNGKKRNLLTFHKMCSYIQQDFDMLHLLTVEETLRISTDLTLPTTTTRKEKQKNIDDILALLNLVKCRHTRVDKLSGGERKRLSIGIELVTNPPIMFFDEPTSGLDSVASFQLLQYLHRLAKNGRIIVCAVHQPSSRQMKLFDDIVVIASGQILYAGPQIEMLNFFETDGYICPQYYNPGDFVLDVSSESIDKLGSFIQRNKDVHCTGKDYGEQTFGHAHEKSRMLNSSENVETTIELGEPVYGDSIPQPQQQHETIQPKSNVNIWTQFRVLMGRSMKILWRDMFGMKLRVITHILIAFMMGMVYWNIGDDADKILSNSSNLFFCILFVFFANAMPTIIACPLDIKVFLREYLNGWYSFWAYYFSKVIADFPIQFFCPSIFILIVYFMTGQPMEFERMGMTWFICFLTSLVGHFMGLTMGSAMSIQSAIFFIPALTIPMLVFSGYFVRLHELSVFLRPICDLSLFRYSLEGALQAIYGYGRDVLKCTMDFCYYKQPAKFLKDMDMLDAKYAYDVLALLIWISILKIIFIVILKIQIRRSK